MSSHVPVGKILTYAAPLFKCPEHDQLPTYFHYCTEAFMNEWAADRHFFTLDELDDAVERMGVAINVPTQKCQDYSFRRFGIGHSDQHECYGDLSLVNFPLFISQLLVQLPQQARIADALRVLNHAGMQSITSWCDEWLARGLGDLIEAEDSVRVPLEVWAESTVSRLNRVFGKAAIFVRTSPNQAIAVLNMPSHEAYPLLVKYFWDFSFSVTPTIGFLHDGSGIAACSVTGEHITNIFRNGYWSRMKPDHDFYRRVEAEVRRRKLQALLHD